MIYGRACCNFIESMLLCFVGRCFLWMPRLSVLYYSCRGDRLRDTVSNRLFSISFNMFLMLDLLILLVLATKP